MQAFHTEAIPISKQNVEIVERAIDAFNRRDLDAALQDLHPEAELDWSRSQGVEAGIYRGYRASRKFWSTLLEMFDPIIISPDEFIERGEHIVVPNHARLWGRDRIKVETHAVAVVTLRGGLIIEWRLYQERAEALKAVGLEKWTMSQESS
jgi:ketosteroid isomerase-like protein